MSFIWLCSLNLYSQVIFTGTVYNSPDQKVYLMNLYHKKIDSAIISPVFPNFTLKAANVTAETYLTMFYQKKGPFILNQFIVLPGEHIVFSCDLASPEKFKWIDVSGSPFTAERVSAFKRATPYKAEIEKDRIQIDSVRENGADTSEIADKLRQVNKDELLANRIYRQLFDTTKSARNASQMLSLLRSSFLLNDDKKDSLLHALQLRFPNDKSIQLLQNSTYLEPDDGLAMNTKAPNIILADINGKEMDISKAHFKYLLIDFWASWCKPCRAESPYLIKTYNKFQHSGFQILSLSIDSKIKRWKDAIKSDGTSAFIQVIDTTAAGSIYLKQYKIVSVPANFLIDRNGTIVAKNLRGDDLYNEVAKLTAAN